MNTQPDIEWACANIPLFKTFKEQIDEVKRSEDEYRTKFAGCPRPVPKEERKAA